MFQHYLIKRENMKEKELTEIWQCCHMVSYHKVFNFCHLVAIKPSVYFRGCEEVSEKFALHFWLLSVCFCLYIWFLFFFLFAQSVKISDIYYAKTNKIEVCKKLKCLICFTNSIPSWIIHFKSRVYCSDCAIIIIVLCF